MRKMGGMLSLLLKSSCFLILSICWVWGITALYLAGPGKPLVSGGMACLFGLVFPMSFFYIRSFWRRLTACLIIFTFLLIWWQTLNPTNNKDWAPEVAQISHGEIQGNTLTMYNVRDFDYKTETIFYQNWQTRSYDLTKFEGLDIFLSYWASDHIAHTIMSWDFGDDGNLAISIETRKDKTQSFSAIKGFFKQFELSYIAADEEDIIRLRTNYRKERVYLYRFDSPKERGLVLLKSYLDEMNKLVSEPAFYNALTRNCTTTIQIHADSAHPNERAPLDWRLIASGHVDELLYDRGVLSNSLPFDQLRKKSRVDLLMQQEGKDDFSKSMRHKNGIYDVVK